MHPVIDCVLPKFLEPGFEPSSASQLIRLGKKWDGGYVVDQRSVLKASRLVSFGLNNDWSFESAFMKQHSVPVAIFDHSVSKRIYLRNFIYHSLLDFSPVQAYRNLSAFFRYPFFFKGQCQHLREHVGYSSVPRMVEFKKALQLAGHQEAEPIFLKIDTEQWEYTILEDLIKAAPFITGLVIEFHRVDLHISVIKDFIDRFPVPLIYTRANNYGHVNPAKQPLLIECTFSAFGVPRQQPFQAAAIDMQNARKLPPYKLSFA